MFLRKDILERFAIKIRNSLCRVINVKMDDNQFSQAVRPAAKGVLGVSFARLLALQVGVKNTLSKSFCLEYVDGTGDDALKRWFELGKNEMVSENEF